jgi:hypothetical protein
MASFAYGLNTASSIKEVAQRLITHLDERLNVESIHWTRDNFEALDDFGLDGFDLKSFHRYKDFEFVWDYIASDDEQGIFLVAESEQATGTRDAESFPLWNLCVGL